jgi:hypothetical protein
MKKLTNHFLHTEKTIDMKSTKPLLEFLLLLVFTLFVQNFLFGQSSTGCTNSNNTAFTATAGSGTITITGGSFVHLEIQTQTWDWIVVCTSCSGSTHTVPAGDYLHVKINEDWNNECQTGSITIDPIGGGPCANLGGDTDSDGVCDNNDCFPSDPSLPDTPGTACNDNDPNTTNDVIQADGCTCAGTQTGGCASQGGDTDGDGVCDNSDCAPTDPNLPDTPGTACNDNDPTTDNDVIQSDGCSCAGTPTGGGFSLWSPNGNYIYYNSGNVGIGTDNPLVYKLTVNGNVGAKEYKATMDLWSDYVFAKDYQLMPLGELERFINTNSHLPGIPSEREVLDNGIFLGEMNALLLAKIEELTLHVIELNKEVEKLKSKN